MNFHSNLTMFKAESSAIELQLEKGMAVKQLTGLFFEGKMLNYFAPQSKVKQHAIQTRLIGFLKRMDAESPDAFIEFTKNNPTFTESKIIA